MVILLTIARTSYAQPSITAVTIPNTAMKIGSVVTATITVADDGGTTYILVAGSTIGGFSLGSLSRTNSTTYTATFTVSDGGSDVPAAATIPVDLTLSDGTNNGGYSTPIDQDSDPIDANRPTVVGIVRAGSTPTSAATVDYTVTFSEAVTGVAAGNFDVTGTATGAAVSGVSGSGTTWTVSITTGGVDGTAELELTDGSGIEDAATNAMTATYNAGEAYTVDKTAPTMDNFTASPSPAKQGAVVTLTFDVTDASSISPNPTVTVNGHGASYGSKSGSTYTYTYTVQVTDGDGAATIAVSATDAAGNPGTGSNSTVLTVDKTVPTVVGIVRAGSTPTSAATVDYTVTFSEAVTGVAAGNFDVTGTATGAAVSGVSGSGTTWTVSITTGGVDGTAELELTDGSGIEDAATNAMTATYNAGEAYTVDKTAPTMDNFTASPSPAKQGAVVTLTFDVTDASSISPNPTVTVNGHGASYGSKSGSTYTYTYTVQVTDGDGAATIAVSATDAAGNPGTGSNSTVLTVDKTAPTGYTVSIDQANIYNGNQSALSFHFTDAEISTTYNYTISSSGGGGSVTGSGTVSSVGQTVSGINVSGLGDGTLTLNVTLTDAAGNTGAAATNNIDKDVVTEQPTLTNPAQDGADNVTLYIEFELPESASAGTVKITFDCTSDSNIADRRIIFNSGFCIPGVHSTTLNADNLGDNANVDSVYTTGTGGNKLYSGQIYTVILEYMDVYGNPKSTRTNTNFSYESNPVTADIVDVSPDPRNVNAGTIQINFNRAVYTADFDLGDFELKRDGTVVPLSGSIISFGPVSSGKASICYLNLTSFTSVEGIYTIRLKATTSNIHDKYGNYLADDATDTWRMDTTNPTVTISSTETSPTKAASIPVRIEFNEWISGFVEGEVTVTNGTKSNFTTVNDSTFTFDIAPASTDCTVSVNIAANVCQDRATNNNNAGSYSIIADRVSPTVVLSDNHPDAIVRDFDNVIITATFTEAHGINTSTPPKITIGTIVTDADMSATGNNLVWEYIWDVPTGDHTNVTASITAYDNAGNLNDPATGGESYTVDNTAPQVISISRAASSPTNSATVDFLVSFDETVLNVLVSNFSLSGTAVGASISGIGGSGNTRTVTVNTGSTDGTLLLNLTTIAGITDVAGNTLGATHACDESYTVDKTAPTLNAVSIASNNTSHPEMVGVGGVVTLTVTGSESIQLTGVTIAGNTVHTDSIAGTGPNWTAKSTMRSTNAEGVVPFTINYVDLAGNAGLPVSATTNGSSVELDKTAPVLSYVSIASNNAIDTSKAIVGDLVTIKFRSNEKIDNIVAKVKGKNALVSYNPDNLTGKAEYTVSSSDTEGELTFTVDFKNYSGNSGLQVTSSTNSTQVFFDKTKPSLTYVSIASFNADTAKAIVGDTVTVRFTASEKIIDVGVTIAGSNADKLLNPSGNNWIAKFKMTASKAEGNIPFTINYKDATGNVGDQVVVTTNSTWVTFDKTPPTLSNVLISSDNSSTSSRARVGNTITLSFFASEAIKTPVVTFETLPATTVDNPGGNSWTATYVLTGAPEESGVVNFSISFEDLSGNGNTPVSTTSNGGKVTIDNVAPTLTNVSISSDNDSPLLAMVGDKVTLSFTSSEGLSGVNTSIGGRAINASGNAQGTSWIAEMVMKTTDNPEGNLAISITFSDSTGNAGIPVTATTLGEKVRFDKTKPLLTYISIATNNADTTKAIVGSQATLTFLSSEGIVINQAEIGGHSVIPIAINNGKTWSASYTFDDDDNEGVQNIIIAYQDSTGNLGVTRTASTNGSSIAFDRVKPTLSNVSIASNNPNTTRAKTGNQVMLTFTASEPIQNLNIQMAGQPADSVKKITGNTWRAYRTVVVGDPEGLVAFSIDFNDEFLNPGVQVTGTSDGSTVTIDNIAPTLGYVSIASNNPVPTRAKVGEVVTLTYTASEGIRGVSALIGGKSATVMGDATGTSWTASYSMVSTDTEGILPFEIVFSDSTGNPASVTTVTNSSFVVFDKKIPVLDTVRIFSSNANPQRAQAGDIVTVKFYASEGLKEEFITTIIRGSTADLNSDVDGRIWTATYQMKSTDDEGVVPFSIVYKDSTGNQGATVTAITKGSNVTFDKTTPTLYDVGITSSNTNPSRAKTNDRITLAFKSQEELLSPAVTFETNPADSIRFDGTTWMAYYTIQGSEGDGAVDFTIDYVDISGNAGTQVSSTTNASSVVIDNLAPTLTDVHIVSGNTLSPQRAKVDDIITLTFTASEAIENVNVSIDMQPASVTATSDKTHWTATYKLNGTDSEGILPISIAFMDLAGNSGVLISNTSDGSLVDFDRTAPSLPFVSIASKNSSSRLAMVGDSVILSFTATEGLRDVMALINNRTAILSNGNQGKSWTAKYKMVDDDINGIIGFTVSYSDSTGNTGASITGTTDNSQVTFDKTAPVLTYVSMASNNADSTWVKVGERVTLRFIATEGIIVAGLTICGSNVTPVAITNTRWEASYAPTPDDTQGLIPFSIFFRDTIGNTATCAATTNGSAVRFDRVIPTIESVTIASNHTNPDMARRGSVVTLDFTASEPIRNVSVSMMDSLITPANIIGNSWRVVYSPIGVEEPGVVPFAITYSDYAGNAGVSVTSTTDLTKVTYDSITPTLTSINLVSNHTNPDRARVGSEVTLTFEASEAIEGVETKIYSKKVLPENQPGTNIWTASYFMTTSDVTQGPIPFTIDYKDLAGNIGKRGVSTTDGSKVVYDRVKPVVSNVSIASDFSNPALAGVGSRVTLSFDVSESIDTLVVKINDKDPDEVKLIAGRWYAWRQMLGTDPQGTVDFSIVAIDSAGNQSSTITATTDGTSVFFDNTPPAISTVNVPSGVYKVGDVIPVVIKADNDSYTAGTVEVNGEPLTLINNHNNTYTVEYTVKENNKSYLSSDSVEVIITLIDNVGQTTTATKATTQAGTFITIDAKIPKIRAFTHNAGANGVLGVGGQILFTLEPETPELGLTIIPVYYNARSLTWSPNTDGSVYSATYTVSPTDVNREEPLQLGDVILSDAAGNKDTCTLGVEYGIIGKKILTTYPSVQITSPTTMAKCRYPNIADEKVIFKFSGRPPFSLNYTKKGIPGSIAGITSDTCSVRIDEGIVEVVSVTDYTTNVFVPDPASPVKATVIVHDLPIVDFTIPYTYSKISGKDNLNLYVSTGSEGSFTLSGEGVGLSGSIYYFYPSLIDESLYNAPIPIKCKFTDSNGCQVVVSEDAYVSGDSVSITLDKSIACYYTDKVTVKALKPDTHDGGFELFKGNVPVLTGWSKINDLTMEVYPNALEPGVYSVKYTATDRVSGQTLTDRKDLTIEPQVVGYKIRGLDPKYCFNALPANPTVSVEGITTEVDSKGHFYCPSSGVLDTVSGKHNATFKFNAVQADKQYRITYYYESAAGCMSEKVDTIITINAPPEVSFSLNDNYNYDTLTIKLNGFPVGGSYSGPGVGSNSDIFYPRNAPLNTPISITYTYTDQVNTGCSNSVSATTRVYRNLEVIQYKDQGAYKELKSAYCYANDSLEIACASSFNDTITGAFSSRRNALRMDGKNRAWYYLNRFANTNDTISFGYNYKGTPYAVSKIVLVDSIGQVSIKDIQDNYCISQSKATVTGVRYDKFIGTEGFTYTGKPVAFANFSSSADLYPAQETPGIYYLTYTIRSSASGCLASTTKQLEVHALPVPAFAYLPANVFIGGDSITLSGNFGYEAGITHFSTNAESASGQSIIVDTTFYPVRTKGGVIPIVYSVTDQFGCKNSITQSINVVKADAQILGFPANGYACYYGDSLRFIGKPNNGLMGGVILGDGVNSKGFVSDTAYFNPKQARSGAHTITYRYLYTDGLTWITHTQTISVDSLSIPLIETADELVTYCSGDRPAGVKLRSSNITSGVTFEGNGVVGNLFFPGEAHIGVNRITGQYTSATSGCTYSGYTDITVNQSPVARFVAENTCSDFKAIPIRFKDESQSGEGIRAWTWSLGGIPSTQQNPSIIFEKAGAKNITLTVETQSGCTNTVSSIVNVGAGTLAKFTWANECVSDATTIPTKLVCTSVPSTGSTIVRYDWKIGSEQLAVNNDSVDYMFGGANTYDVKLVITSDANCKDSITKSITIKPIIKVSELERFCYNMNFDGANDWEASGLTETDSCRWRLGYPAGSVISYPASGDRAWFMKLNDPKNIENSSVMSPCFDLSGLRNPMIRLDVWSSSEQKRDGAVMQYSLDGGISWSNLGAKGAGINWFNSDNILSNPGSQKTGEAQGWNELRMTKWYNARHNLDVALNGRDVRFRVAYASNGQLASVEDGFAFDNVWIGEKQQNVLMEYFTNTNQADAVILEPTIKQFERKSLNKVIPIHYHSSYQPDDPFYQAYPNGSSSRMANYGISKVPYAFANGMAWFDFPSGQNATTYFKRIADSVDVRSLCDPLMDLSLSVSRSGNTMSIAVALRAKVSLSGRTLAVQCALVKDSIDAEGKMYYNVLRRFIPDPSGTLVTSNLGQGQEQTVNLSWTPGSDNDLVNTSIVAFVQDVQSYEIYQSCIVNRVGGIWTDIDPVNISNLVNFFPNPATDRLIIECEYPIDRLEVFDITGRLVQVFQPEQRQFVAPVETLRNGIYIMRGVTSKGEFTKKFVKQK